MPFGGHRREQEGRAVTSAAKLGFDWSPHIEASSLDHAIYFGGSFRYDSDVELTMFVGSLYTLVDPHGSDVEDGWADAKEVPLAHAIAYAWDGDLADEADSFLDCLDAITSDTHEVATRVVEWMNECDDDMFDFIFRRVVVLDAVDVAPVVRGRGLGKLVAAYTMHAAGAWTDGVLVAAINGTREPHDPSVAHAAVGVCAGLGLERFGSTSLWVGNTSMTCFLDRMEKLLTLSSAPVRHLY